MAWTIWIRNTHRWVSLVFTLTVIANFAVMPFAPPPPWIVYAPLPPLFLLLLTGLTMFVTHYTGRRAAVRRTG